MTARPVATGLDFELVMRRLSSVKALTDYTSHCGQIVYNVSTCRVSLFRQNCEVFGYQMVICVDAVYSDWRLIFKQPSEQWTDAESLFHTNK